MKKARKEMAGELRRQLKWRDAITDTTVKYRKERKFF